ncbi:AraC family transcriptional regulator [Desulfosarcina cetonica]|uniref:AraC family transcriptional regulator n=1 Tax=Desulfosarcina cetonica TaxID=90730 RepID=UPI0006D03F79|nr:AraC family transcriptional regulator [Desulfosarcina cetonica]
MKRRIDVRPNDNRLTLSELGKRSDPCEDVGIDDHGFYPYLRCESIRIRPGVRLVMADHTLDRQICMKYEIDRAPVSFCFSLSQRMRCTMRQGHRSTTVAERVPGDGVIAYLPKTQGTVDIFPDRHVAGVSLHFSVAAFCDLFPSPPECLAHLTATAHGSWKDKPVYRQTRFSAKTLHVLEQIMGCPYTGDIRNVFLEAKALELVALNMAERVPGHCPVSPELDRRDVDRVKEAYHILLTRLDHPPSLVDLSRSVGLNRNKLNRGFKALYGGTAFALLRRERLSKARFLLDNSDLSLSEIALSVGYNSQANFTTAFRRRFGTPPNTFRR